MHQALIVWIAVVAISAVSFAFVIFALLSAEPRTLELSVKEAVREPPPEAPSQASQITDSTPGRNPDPIP